MSKSRQAERKQFSHADSLIVEPITSFLSNTITALKPYAADDKHVDELQEKLNQIRLELVDKRNTFADKYAAASLIESILNKVKALKIDKLTYFDTSKVKSALETLHQKIGNKNDIKAIESNPAYTSFTRTMFAPKKVSPEMQDIQSILATLGDFRGKLGRFSNQGDSKRHVAASTLANNLLAAIRHIDEPEIDLRAKQILIDNALGTIQYSWEKIFGTKYSQVQEAERSFSSKIKSDGKLSLKQIFQDFNRVEEKAINLKLTSLRQHIQAKQPNAEPPKAASKK
jgi:hypothetical protein